MKLMVQCLCKRELGIKGSQNSQRITRLRDKELLIINNASLVKLRNVAYPHAVRRGASGV
jgi:hypothetical protein